MFDKLTTVMSQCVDEIRTYTKIEGDDCILPFTNEIILTEYCSEIEDYIYSWPMLLSFGLLAGLLVLGLSSGACYNKYNNTI